MNDQVTKIEIEDVLSSIRRLVSEETRADAPRRSPPKPAKTADRLVLTPALRVATNPESPVSGSESDTVDPSDDPVLSDPPEPGDQPWKVPEAKLFDAAEAASPDPEHSDGQQINEPMLLRPEQEVAAEEPSNFRSDSEDDEEGGESCIEDYHDHFEFSEKARRPEFQTKRIVPPQDEPAFVADADADAPVKAGEQDQNDDLNEAHFGDNNVVAEDVVSDLNSGDALDEPGQPDDARADLVLELVPEDVTDFVDDPSDHELPSTAMSDPIETAELEPADDHIVDDAELVDTPQEGELIDTPQEAELLDTAQEAERVNNLTAKIEALEAAIGRSQDQFEPDGTSSEPYSGTRVAPIEWPDGDRDDLAEAEIVDLPKNPKAMQSGPQPEGADDGDIDDSHDTDTERAQGTEDAFLDEETLRELVADIVREELQGVLGERITRNVRKLVRREIHRTLATRELE